MSPRLSDPEGRRALFEAPPTPPAASRYEGREAFFSAGPRRPATALVECSSCRVRTRVSWVDAAMRVASLSLWIPLRHYGRRIRCPACGRRTWCRVGWTD